MIKLNSSACIDATVESTWKILSQIENIDLWSEPIETSFCSGDISRGIGAERTCELKGNIAIHEKWIEWDEGKSFTYLGFNIPLTKSAKNTWSVISENGKTLLTSEVEIVLKGGIFGKLLEPLMHQMSKRMGANALAAFKYLVENERPYKGKYSSLPRAPITC